MVGESLRIRNLNKVYLWQGNSYFEAYLPSGFSFNVKAKQRGTAGEVSGALMTAAANIAGMVPAFDIPRWFLYQGTDPVAFTIQCYLRLGQEPTGLMTQEILVRNNVRETNPFTTSILAPLLFLYNLMLPTQGTPLVQVPVVGSLLNIFSKIPYMENVSQIADAITTLKVPKAYDISIPMEQRQISLKVGKSMELMSDAQRLQKHPISFGDVILTGVETSLGKLIIDKGYPERVDLTISLETLRVASTNMMSQLFQ